MIKRLLRKVLNQLGFEPVRKAEFERLVNFAKRQHPSASLWSVLNQSQRGLIGNYMEQSKSQLAQDLFVLSQLGKDTDKKFFVEFGATNGIDLSNTWLLEQAFGWTGILAEPAKIWHRQLAENRKCRIDHRCVYSESGLSLGFTEAKSAELSGISQEIHASDQHSKQRLEGNTSYLVPTISLNDLLTECSAPDVIGYMSVDTEGSEFTILNKLDFDRWKFMVITVEHNFCEPSRSKIRDLLLRNGYEQKFPDISRWDDWYVLRD
jgi:FkbM family methyltransferase